jgi:HEAT repeat protein
MYIFGIYIDLLSFWLGVAIATVGWWLLSILRPIVQQIFKSLKEQREAAKARVGSGIEENYRKITHRKAQAMHLASSLFALDEIIEPPLLLAPPPQIEPGIPPYHEDIVSQSLPYLPAWPELGAAYHAPTLTLPQALSGGVNLIVYGQPGTGKTTALGYLASLIVNRSPLAGGLQDRTPFIIHAADLDLPLKDVKSAEALLEPIIRLVEADAPVFDRARVPDFVSYAFREGRALLLLDGVDEITPAAMQDVSAYLRPLLKAFPKARIVATGAPEHVDGLISLGFVPMALMPWSPEKQKRFLTRWADLWERYVAVEVWAQTTAQPLDSILINRWLDEGNLGLTPLEYTLKVWAAYAGDARGPRAIDAIEAHIRRLTPSGVPAEALQTLGMQVNLSSQPIFNDRKAREWVKSFETPEELSGADQLPVDETGTATDGGADAVDPVKAKKKDKAKKGSSQASTPRANLLSKLAMSGLLTTHGGSRLRFLHPVFSGLLAGKALMGRNAEPLLQQPAWTGRTLTMQYVAAFGDATPLVNGLLAMEDRPLERNKITAGRLLKDAPRNAAWRGKVMSALVEILQKEDTPLGLRGQALAAFAFSGDPNAAALFRSLLALPSPLVRRLAAFGAGILRDEKAIEQIAQFIGDPSPGSRMAACLALTAVGTRKALESVAGALVHGDDALRGYAAEALANNSVEGHEALREGIHAEDIPLRHAVVFGLARIAEPWALELLEKVQTEDQQWVVRNAAVEALDARQRINPCVPRLLTAPSETPWLIEFAGKFGMGVTPGQPATDIFLLALKNDDHEIRMGALNYLRYMPSEGVIGALYPHLYSEDYEMREAAYGILAEMAMSGTQLPDPHQYGLG